MAAYISDGTLLSCSDGSHDPEIGKGSHGWLFSDSDGNILWSGSGPIDCHPDLLSSYRSELGGILTILAILKMIIDSYEITAGSITLYCNNQGALDNVFDKQPKRGIFPLLQRDFELLGSARSLLAELPVKVVGHWVKGHYTGPDRELQHDLNEWADTLAGNFWSEAPPHLLSRRMPENHPTYEAVVYYDQSALTAKLKTVLYEHKYAASLQATIVKNTKWEPEWFHRISWMSYATAFRALTIFKKITIAKLSHVLWNTGAQKHLYNPDEAGTCPCCQTAFKTFSHVFRCQDAGILTAKQKWHSEFRESLAKFGTPVVLLDSLSRGVDMLITSAYSEQTQLGWDQLLRGCMSNKWGKAYVHILKPTTPIQDAQLWETKITRILWTLLLQIWNYRNKDLHGHDKEDAMARCTAALHQQTGDMYTSFTTDPH